MKIKTNKIQCRHCGDVIESEYAHDFKSCSCGAVFVDGGRDYLRRGCRNGPDEDYIELSDYEEEEEDDKADPRDPKEL